LFFSTCWLHRSVGALLPPVFYCRLCPWVELVKQAWIFRLTYRSCETVSFDRQERFNLGFKCQQTQPCSQTSHSEKLRFLLIFCQCKMKK
jgi:hypothetical protein